MIIEKESLTFLTWFYSHLWLLQGYAYHTFKKYYLKIKRKRLRVRVLRFVSVKPRNRDWKAYGVPDFWVLHTNKNYVIPLNFQIVV